MICEGASPRSWMMYSPRSVSIASMPAASIAALRPISSEIIDLPLVTALAPRALQRSRKIRRASAASRAKCTWPPSSHDLALIGLEIEIEMGERVVLDVARAVAQRVELGQASGGLGARGDEIAATCCSACCSRASPSASCAFSLKCGVVTVALTACASPALSPDRRLARSFPRAPRRRGAPEPLDPRAASCPPCSSGSRDRRPAGSRRRSRRYWRSSARRSRWISRRI